MNAYFWRTTNQTEIDLIVTRGNTITAIETKLKRTAPPRGFRSFRTYYPEAETRLVSREDFLEASSAPLFLTFMDYKPHALRVQSIEEFTKILD